MTCAMQGHRGIVAGNKVGQAIPSSWDVDGTQATLVECLKKGQAPEHVACNGIMSMETINKRHSGSIVRVAQNLASQPSPCPTQHKQEQQGRAPSLLG